MRNFILHRVSLSPILVMVSSIVLFGAVSLGTEQTQPNEDVLDSSVFNESNDSQNPFIDLSIEELMEVELEISSASRQAHKQSELSVPVSIITAEDIHYSGLTEIPEILQFVTGVDVLKLDRRRYAVGIRGLHEFLSDRTTLLINGRSADNPIYGGPDFQGLPTLIEDIERIEVIRGAGSASWGANALTGVINVVTKKPKDIQGFFGSTTFTGFCDSYSHWRWADSKGSWSWRISGGYQDTKDSEGVLSGADFEYLDDMIATLLPVDRYQARDFSRNFRFDSEAFYGISETTELWFGIGVSHIDAGDYDIGGLFPQKNSREEHIRPFVRIDHQWEDGSSGYLQWAGKFWSMNWPQAARVKSGEYTLDTQYNFSLGEDHQTSIGADFQWDHINSSKELPEQAEFEDEPFNEYGAGVFAIDRWTLSERFDIEGQARIDWYSPAQMDWSGRLTGIYSLDEKRNHILRASAAKAFRSPLLAIRESSKQGLMVFGMPLFNVVAAEDLDNEQTYALELGYNGTFANGICFRADSYFQTFDKIISYEYTTNAFQQQFIEAENGDQANSWGTELELSLKRSWGKLSAWYAYNDFDPSQSDQDFRAFLPSKHKTGVTGRLFLPDDWVLNANYRFMNTTPGNPATGNDVERSHRLDVTLSRKIFQGQGELMLGVSDLLNRTYDPILESIQLAGHEVPGRTCFARVQFRF
jgi:outer membrane receptor for ferrienterochelin and colicin